MVPGKPRLRKTFADYVAILIAPLLIMAMVGSLVFFLLEAFVGDSLDGRIGTRLRWVMFWFVIGSVLVGRIAVQEGSAYAGIYAFGLAAATGMWIMKFFGLVWIPIGLLALIWWSTHKLTWDVTLIDEDEDASGEGLLQAAGVDLPETSGSEDSDSPSAADDAGRVPLWKRLFVNTSERKGKAHSPGLWIVWISLVALPVFGFGQLGLDDSDGERRTAFIFLMIYIVAALGLLLCASFLGLRRYLRQRLLKMPLGVTGSWVTLGVGITIATLLACLILPRPDASMSLPQLVDKVSDAAQEASEWAFLKDAGVEDEEGRKIGEGDQDDPDGENGAGGTEGEEKQGDSGMDGEEPGKEMGDQKDPTDKKEPSDPSDQTDPEKKDASGKESAQGKGEGEGQTGEGKSGETGDQPKTGESGETTPQSETGPEENPDSQNTDAETQAEEMGEMEQVPDESAAAEEEDASSMEWVGSLVKWLIYAALAGGAIWFGWRHRKEILAVLRQFWANILALFGRKPGRVRPAEEEEETPELPHFAAFANPFATGAAQSQPPEELVRYTFEALQAWARERELERPPDQTPIEFARSLGAFVPELAHEAGQLTRLYSGYAYAGRPPAADCLTMLQTLWAKLG